LVDYSSNEESETDKVLKKLKIVPAPEVTLDVRVSSGP